MFVLQKKTRKQLRWDEPASTKEKAMFGDSGTTASVRAGSTPITALQRELWTLEGHGLASIETFNGIVESLIAREEASTGAAGATGAVTPPLSLSNDDVVLNRCLTRHKAGRAALAALSLRRGKKTDIWTEKLEKRKGDANALALSSKDANDPDLDEMDDDDSKAVVLPVKATEAASERAVLLKAAHFCLFLALKRLRKERQTADTPSGYQPLPRAAAIARDVFEMAFRERLQAATGGGGDDGRSAAAASARLRRGVKGPDADMWFVRMERCALTGSVVLATTADRRKFFPDGGAVAIPGHSAGGSDDADNSGDGASAAAPPRAVAASAKGSGTASAAPVKAVDKKRAAAAAATDMPASSCATRGAAADKRYKTASAANGAATDGAAVVAAAAAAAAAAEAAAAVLRPGDAVLVDGRKLGEGTLRLQGSKLAKVQLRV